MLIAQLHVKLLDDFAVISTDAWERLLATSGTQTIFQTMAWQRAWWKSFGKGKLLLIGVYEAEQLVAVAPLFADQGMVFFVGSGGSDYLDFIGSSYQPHILISILKLARLQVSNFVGFRFYHVPDASLTGSVLTSVARELGLTCFDEGSLEAPALRFKDWPSEKRLPTEKKSLIRHERTLKKKGQLETEHFTRPSQIEPLLTVFFEQHIGRWAGTSFPSLFLDEKQREFYYTLCELVGLAGCLRFTRVTLNDQPIAFHLGFMFQGIFLWYKPSFDINLAHQSPGEVLLRSLLMRSREEDAQVFDFGLGDEPFKQRFLTETNQVRTWGLYPTIHSSIQEGT